MGERAVGVGARPVERVIDVERQVGWVWRLPLRALRWWWRWWVVYAAGAVGGGR